MNSASGWAAFTRPISPGQYSSPGGGPARSPQVRAKTSFVISIAMSQRTPSHWPRMPTSVSATASRGAGAKAVSWTTPGQRVPGGARHLVQGQRPAAIAPQALQPHRGVDLVDRRSGREAHGSLRRGSGQQEQQRDGARPARLVAGADAGAVVAVEVLVE